MKIETLQNKLEELKTKKDSLFGQYTILEKQISESKLKIEQLQHNRQLYKKEVELMDKVQQVTKVKIEKGINTLITYALRYIKDPKYDFRLAFGRQGSLQTLFYEIITPKNSEWIEPDGDTSGGGVLDILSVSMRMALIQIAKIQGIIALDETFKHLSVEFIPNAAKFLIEVNKKLKRQIIMITQNRMFIDYADNVIESKDFYNNIDIAQEENKNEKV